MLILTAGDHCTDTDPWPWGGEPIFRDGKYAGRVTTTAYGFSIDRHVCLGFVHDYEEESGDDGGRIKKFVSADWVKVKLYITLICRFIGSYI
jgi:glycine cleavage system aminomethyltransferase T